MSNKLVVKKGTVYGRFTIIKEVDPYVSPSGKTKRRTFLCECSCSAKTRKKVLIDALRTGSISSCGCIQKEDWENKSAKSGYGDPIHSVYRGMLHRCYDKSNKHYDDYGGRGIKVCKRWRNGDGKLSGFQCFKKDMGDRPKGFSIDREDNNGNYEPNNCRWTTFKVQANNRRSNTLINYKGETYTITQLVENYASEHVTLGTFIHRRTSLGWSIKKSLTHPLRAQR